MRLPCAGLAAVATLFALGVAPAAATPVSGKITRVGGNVVRVELTNAGTADDIAVAVNFHPPVTVVTASRVSGPAGNCSPSATEPNRVECLLDPPGLAPGQTIVIEVLTNPRVEDNAGANAYSCGIPCNTSMMSGPYAVTGPPPDVPPADLTVSLVPTPLSDVSLLGTPLARAWTFLHVVVINRGPNASAPAGLLLSTSAAPLRTEVHGTPFSARAACRDEPDRGQRQHVVACDIPALEPDDFESVEYRIELERPGQLQAHAELSPGGPDPNPSNNTATYSDEFARLPEASGARLIRASGADLFVGAALGATRVNVAVARVEDGAKPVGSAAGCRWLTSKRVRFRRERGRRCDEPSYLTARVRRGRWQIRLRKKLPPGRYVMTTRAETADGVIQGRVSARRGSVERFRVR